MFGRQQRHVFKPTAYGANRRTRRIPRWLVLMLTGIVLGAGGLLFLQKSYGPPRLTVEQSEQLHYDLNSLGMDKQRLQAELTKTKRELTEATAKVESQSKSLVQAQTQIDKQSGDIKMFAEAMPADPRGTSPGIRAASFRSDNNKLIYQILIMQDAGKAAMFNGNAEFTVAGRYSNGRSGSITLPPFDLSLERYVQVEDEVDLPEGFRPRQVTIKIRRDGADKVVATRTLIVSK
ncbi:DUF6776 family protein [Allopusillimonas ginsengisoli]|uniref:DUF6776 family protein n=1 Tax=Allopusillimonas ginsengisoli TaxID=453575 RepID=UPI0039C04E52